MVLSPTFLSGQVQILHIVGQKLRLCATATEFLDWYEKEKDDYNNYLGTQYSMIIKTVLLNINFTFLVSLLFSSLHYTELHCACWKDPSYMCHTHRIARSTDSNGQQDNIGSWKWGDLESVYCWREQLLSFSSQLSYWGKAD